MGILLCEQNFREVWSRNESVRAEIGQILRTHTTAAKLVVRIIGAQGLMRSCPNRPPGANRRVVRKHVMLLLLSFTLS